MLGLISGGFILIMELHGGTTEWGIGELEPVVGFEVWEKAAFGFEKNNAEEEAEKGDAGEDDEGALVFSHPK